jgi:hypothetical protein
MDLDERKLAVRQFYEQFCEANPHVTLFETVVGGKCPEVCPIYQQIASLKLLAKSVSSGFDRVEIQRLNQNIPQTVSDAFERHFWYSQWTLSELFLVKLQIAGQDAFFCLLQVCVMIVGKIILALSKFLPIEVSLSAQQICSAIEM